MIGKSDSFAGRTVLITGSSSGIGLAMARLFAEREAAVVMIDVAAERLAAAEVEGEVTKVVADVARREDVDRAIDAALSSHGKIDVLCNNAGINDRMMPVVEMTDELWERVMGVNLFGPFYMCRRVLPRMIEAGRGVIINTASVAGIRGSLGGAAYTASKHGLIGLTRNIAAMYADRGVRCVAICPGSVLSGITLGGEPSPLGRAVLDRAIKTLPRRGESEEIAEVAAFLASDRASMMNGEVVVVDHGWMAL